MDVSEFIISMVRENECIYVKTDKDFKNIEKKKRVYKLISEKLKAQSGIEMSAENVEKRWSSLRDMFSRALRNLKSQPSGSGYEPTKKWDLYDDMSFLTPHVSHRRSKSNIPNFAFVEVQNAETLNDDERDIKISPESFNFISERSSTSSMTTDLKYEVAEASPTVPTCVPNDCSSNSSSATPVIWTIYEPPVVPELENFARKRRKSSCEIKKEIDTATDLLGKVVEDLSNNTARKDPYILAVEEGLRHVPLADKTKCLIEILQIIDKYQKI